jgi:hypothetical protein
MGEISLGSLARSWGSSNPADDLENSFATGWRDLGRPLLLGRATFDGQECDHGAAICLPLLEQMARPRVDLFLAQHPRTAALKLDELSLPSQAGLPGLGPEAPKNPLFFHFGEQPSHENPPLAERDGSGEEVLGRGNFEGWVSVIGRRGRAGEG